MSFFDKHKIPRRMVLAWCCWLITVTITGYLEHVGEVNTTDGFIITTVIGILSIVIAYQRQDQ